MGASSPLAACHISSFPTTPRSLSSRPKQHDLPQPGVSTICAAAVFSGASLSRMASANADDLVPMLDRELAGDDGRCAPVPVGNKTIVRRGWRSYCTTPASPRRSGANKKVAGLAGP